MKRSEKIKIAGKILLEVLKEANEVALALDKEIGMMDLVCEPISRCIEQVENALQTQVFLWELIEAGEATPSPASGAYGPGLIDPRYTGD